MFFESAPEKRDVVGAVTSSTIGPLVGAAPIAIGMVKFKHITPGTRLVAEAEGGAMLGAVVQERPAVPEVIATQRSTVRPPVDPAP